MVRSLADGAIVAGIPMVRRTNLADSSVYQAAFLPPKMGAYQAFLRIHALGGSARFTAPQLNLWADPRGKTTQAVVFVGDQYGEEEKAVLFRVLGGELESLGMTLQMVDIRSAGQGVYQALLPHYMQEDRLVVWLGRQLDANEQAAFSAFLAGGGRLLLASYGLDMTPNIGPSMRDVLHASSSSGRRRARLLPITSADAADPLQFSALHAPLTALAPAEVLLLNNREQVAALRLDNGAYRLDYLSFDLPVQEESAIRSLLHSSVQFLQSENLSEISGKYAEYNDANELMGNYPNPFNAQTTIRYRLAAPAKVALTLFNVLGQQVRKLVDERKLGGLHTATWDGADEEGRPVGNGVYFYALSAGEFKQTRRLLVIK